MDCLDHHLLACPRSPANENRPVRESNPLDLLPELSHGDGRADELAQGVVSSTTAEVEDLPLEAPPTVESLKDGKHQLLTELVLENVVVGPHAHRGTDLRHLIGDGHDDGY